MSITWLAPAAFAGAALLLLPVLIHLLTRQERRPVPFPSLRFLQATRFTAMKRRLIDDWPLLVMRLAAIACGVAALASPLFVTDARRNEWASRVSRAIIVAGAPPAIDDEPRTAFAAKIFALGEPAADAVHAAMAWLDAQPASAREIVIAGDLRAGTLGAADLAGVPGDVGVRFLPAEPRDASPAVIVPLLVQADGSAANVGLPVRLDEARTVVSWPSPISGLEPSQDAAAAAGGAPLAVRASAEDQAIADAALRAVLAEHVVLDQAQERRVVVAWPGADLADLGPAVTPPSLAWIAPAVERLARPAQQRGRTLVVTLSGRPVDERAAIDVSEIARAVFDDRRSGFESRRPMPEELAAWSRPPGAPSADAPFDDQGDRRWFWAAALALLAVEQVWRRRGGPAHDADASATSEGARVA